MIVSRAIGLAAVVAGAGLVAMPAAFALNDELGTQWLQERREDRLKEQRERRMDADRRDPLVTPGSSSGTGTQNPVAPRSRSLAPGTLPWNAR